MELRLSYSGADEGRIRPKNLMKLNMESKGMDTLESDVKQV